MMNNLKKKKKKKKEKRPYIFKKKKKLKKKAAKKSNEINWIYTDIYIIHTRTQTTYKQTGRAIWLPLRKAVSSSISGTIASHFGFSVYRKANNGDDSSSKKTV